MYAICWTKSYVLKSILHLSHLLWKHMTTNQCNFVANFVPFNAPIVISEVTGPPSFITLRTLAKSACSLLTAAVFSKQLFSQPPPERKRVLQLLADRRHLLVVACKTIYITKLYVLHTSLKLNLPHCQCLWTFLKLSKVLPIPESPRNIVNINYITFEEPIGLFADDFMTVLFPFFVIFRTVIVGCSW